MQKTKSRRSDWTENPHKLSDDELAFDPHVHRYAIAARRLPELREVRARFLGRALRSSPEAWQTQVETIIKKACV